MSMNKDRLKLKQRKAIYLLVACQQEIDSVAITLGVKPGTVRGWMKKPSFQAKLEEAMKRLEDHDAKKRRSTSNKMITDKIYEEVHRRVINGRDLKDISFLSLIRVMKEMNFETRLDAGEATDHTKKTHSLDDLIARYKDSRSKDYDKPELRLVQQPAKKEVANG